MKTFTLTLRISLILCGFLILSGCRGKDPYAVKDHHTQLLLTTDTLKLDMLRLPVVKGDTIRQAQIENLSQSQLQKILEDLLGKRYRNKVLGLNLYAEYNAKTPLRQWNIDKSAISHVSFFYLSNDSLKFDIYNLHKKTSRSFENLSDAYCNIPLMFMMKERQHSRGELAVVYLLLRSGEMIDKELVILGKMENDSLYKAGNLFFAKIK